MYPEVQSALTSLNILKNWWSAHNEITESTEMSNAISQINQSLIATQDRLFTCQQDRDSISGRVSFLENEITKFKDRKSEIDKYEPHQFPTGSRALISKPLVEGGQQPSYLCESCADKGEVSHLQPDGYHNGKSYYLKCHNCSLTIPIIRMTNALERKVSSKLKR